MTNRALTRARTANRTREPYHRARPTPRCSRRSVKTERVGTGARGRGNTPRAGYEAAQPRVCGPGRVG